MAYPTKMDKPQHALSLKADSIIICRLDYGIPNQDGQTATCPIVEGR